MSRDGSRDGSADGSADDTQHEDSRETREAGSADVVPSPSAGPRSAPGPGETESADAAAAATAALARARRAAREKGLRPGLKPLRRRRPDSDTRSGTGRDARDPALLGDQLERLVADRDWKLDVAAGSVMGRWPQIVGPDVAAHVVPVRFEDGVLVLRADSSAWASQLRLLTSALLGRLAEEAGPGVVSELQVHGPSAPSWAKGPRRVKGRGPRDTYG